MDETSLIGRSIDNRYRLLEVIGDGGMGRVFRAEQLSTGRAVAIKLLHAQFSGIAEVVQRFQREAAVTARLSHPNIVKVVEFGTWQGRLYLATEFLPGRSLGDLLDPTGRDQGERLPVRRTIALMRPVLEALDYAHRRGVVHRDMKPENIMVVPARGILSREAVKLLDFGIAKLGEDDAESPGPKLTQLGLVLGTPGYMSPEQAAGQKADARSDLYSCGVILYEMLAGHRPFTGDNLQVLAMHVTAPPPSLRATAGGASIPPQVEAVVMRALAKRPADRFQSARELRLALDRVANLGRGDAAVSGTDKTVLATRPTPRRRARWMPPAIVALALALLIGEHLRPGAFARYAGIVSSDRRSALTEAQGPSRHRTSRPSSKRHAIRP